MHFERIDQSWPEVHELSVRAWFLAEFLDDGIEDIVLEPNRYGPWVLEFRLPAIE
jgi:hypothetical protein